MAKKQQVSYSPNTSLIAGARTVAESEAMMQSAGGAAFAEGFTGAVLTGIEEQAKSKAKMDAYASMVKLPDNISMVDETNRPEIFKFVQQTRANVVQLAKAYEKTKDQNILDELQMEKAKIVNLNNQLMNYANEAREYMTASDKNQIARGKSFDYKKYDNIYSKNSTFNIDSDGNIGFVTDGTYDKWNDVAGRWNVKNNTWGLSLLDLDNTIVNSAKKGGRFDETGVYNNTTALFNQMGTEEVQVALEQDVTGDAYENLSFEAIWSGGKMDSKYYEGFDGFKNQDGTYNSDWMFNDENVKQATNLMAKYTTDVLKTRHNANYIDPNARPTRTTASYILESQSKASTINNVINDGITLEGLQSIAIDPKLSREIQSLDDGTFQIIDSQGQPTIIDPKKPEQARSILYNLSKVRSSDRISGKKLLDE